MSYTPTATADAPLRPSVVESGSGEIILTATDILKDKPQHLTRLFQQYGRKTPFLSKVRMMGFSRGVGGPETGHYEEPRETRTFKVGSIIAAPAAPEAGKNMTIELASTDMYTYTDSLGNPHYDSRPRKFEEVKTVTGKSYVIVDKDKTVNPHRLILRPGKTTYDATVDITANAMLFIIGPERGEGSGGVAPLDERYQKYTNTFTIMKEKKLFSGTYLTTEAPFTFEEIEGKSNLFYLRGIEKFDVRHAYNKSMKYIFGEQHNNIIDDGSQLETDVPVYGTEGMLDFVSNYGFTDEYGASTVDYTIDDFWAISGYAEERRLPGNKLVALQGYKLNHKLNQLLKDYFDNTMIKYVSETYMSDILSDEQISPEGLFATIGFRGLSVGSYDYLFTGLDEFNDIEGGGAAGFKYNQGQLILPLGTFRNAKANKMENGASYPFLGYEYRSAGNYSRENEMWKHGGAGPITKTTEFDIMNCELRTEFATHFGMAEYWIWQKTT